MGFWILLVSYSLTIFSSPMPAHITWIEVIIGSGLTLATLISIPKLFHKAHESIKVRFYLIISSALTLYPLFIGVLFGNKVDDIIRDIIPLMFLILVPIIFISYSESKKKILKHLTSALVFVAILSMVFFYVKALTIYGSLDSLRDHLRMGFGFDSHENDFIKNDLLIASWRTCLLWIYDPSVLFSAIYVGVWGITLIGDSWKSAILGLILLGVSIFIAYAFMLIPLRAYVFLYAAALLVSLMWLIRTKGFYLRLIPILMFAIFIMHNEIILCFNLLLNKQQAVGANGKLDEFSAVMNYSFESPFTFVFGHGWGSLVDNPALGFPTRFTHSLLSFLLLKGGVLSLIMLFVSYGYIFSDYFKVGRIEINTRILMLSALPIFIVGVFLEPIYKMLSFGVVIGLIFIIADQSNTLKKVY